MPHPSSILDSPLATPDQWRSLLAALASGEVLWREVDRIASLAGLTHDHAADLLALLDDAGWIEVLESDDDDSGPAVCLTELGAARCEVKVVHLLGRDYWVPLTQRAPVPRQYRQPHMIGLEEALESSGDDDDAGDGLALLIDPRALDPADLAAIAESIPVRPPDPFPDLDPPRDPRCPTLLLGLRADWCQPRRLDDRCPGCRSAPLPRHAYCLLCDAWGLDPGQHRRSSEVA